MPRTTSKQGRAFVPAQRSTPGPAPVQPLLRATLHLDEAGYDAVALRTRTSDGWRSLTYSQLRSRSAGLADALRARGVRTGDRVAILAEPGDGWVTGLFGVLRAGAVVVPLDRSLTPEELQPILRDCGAVGCLVSPAYADPAAQLQDKVASLGFVVDLSNSALAALTSMDDGPVDGDRVRRDDDTAVVAYTSDTMGGPQGVVLTYADLVHQVRGMIASQELTADNVFLSLLPLSQMLELTCGLLSPLAIGARVCYSPTLYPHEIAELIQEQRVTGMVVMPLLLRLLKESIEAQVRHQPALVRAVFGLQHTLARLVPVAGARRAMFAPFHRRFGGRLAMFYCGGAPLDDDVVDFFERMGFSVLQGYGLAETSPVVAMNTSGAHRELGRLDDDGSLYIAVED
jgi:long-chain acyl-CoA synthetase